MSGMTSCKRSVAVRMRAIQLLQPLQLQECISKACYSYTLAAIVQLDYAQYVFRRRS